MNLKYGCLVALAILAMPGSALADPSSAPARPTAEPLAAISAPAEASAQTPAPAAKHPNFAGVWQLTSMDRVIMPESNGEFTPQAKANLDHFKQYYKGEDADPAVKVCLSKGMPWSSLIRARDYPVEIYQAEDRIIMLYELYDQWRSIRINGAPKPDNYPESVNGYSVAHWDGDTLVIETTGMLALNPIGPHQRSASAKIVERWHLKQDPELGELLVVDLVQDDPEVYVKPAVGHNEMKRAAPDVVVGGYNCGASLWDDHVARMEQAIAARQARKAGKARKSRR